MKIFISNKIFCSEIPAALREAIVDRLTFQNPRWVENEKYGRWQGDTDEFLQCFDGQGNALLIPRGFTRQLISLARQHGEQVEIHDNRRTLPEVDFRFKGTLRPYQDEAAGQILSRDFGTLSAPTGSGKTVIALKVIAERRQPALIIVHTKELFNQWVERIETFLGIPAKEIGRIGEGKLTIGERVTVATVQSLYKCAEKVSPHIGFLVVDECHRTPSRTFTEAVSSFDSRFMLGLSATPWRRDGLSRLIYFYLGDVVHEIGKQGLMDSGAILPFEVVFRETVFTTDLDASLEYSRMLSELCQDPDRNALIAADVIIEAGNGSGVCLILTDRKAHAEELKSMIEGGGVHCDILTGDIGDKEREAGVHRLNAGRSNVIVATGQLIGEGFDCKSLSCLFLSTPIKFDGRLIQYLGRVLRPAPGKEKAKIYDYVDSQVGVLMNAARSRFRLYKERAAA